MAAGQVVLGAHLAGSDASVTKDDVALGQVVVKGIILVANGVVFFPNASFQDVRVHVEPAQVGEALLVVGRSAGNHAGVGRKRNAAGERGVQDFHYIGKSVTNFCLAINISNSATPPASLSSARTRQPQFTGAEQELAPEQRGKRSLVKSSESALVGRLEQAQQNG